MTPHTYIPPHPFHTTLNTHRTIWAGKVPIGSEHPIACQTMGTTDTRDVMATVEQAMRVADYGGDLFRITVQVFSVHGSLKVEGGRWSRGRACFWQGPTSSLSCAPPLRPPLTNNNFPNPLTNRVRRRRRRATPSARSSSSAATTSRLSPTSTSSPRFVHHVGIDMRWWAEGNGALPLPSRTHTHISLDLIELTNQPTKHNRWRC